MHLSKDILSNGSNFASLVMEVKEEVERRWTNRERTSLAVVDEVMGDHQNLQKHERERVRENVISIFIEESAERIRSGRKIGQPRTPEIFGGRHPHSDREIICVRDRQLPNGDR